MSVPEHVVADIAGHLDRIAIWFKGNPKVTLLVRNDLGDGKDADFVLTADTLPEAIAALQRREAASK